PGRRIARGPVPSERTGRGPRVRLWAQRGNGRGRPPTRCLTQLRSAGPVFRNDAWRLPRTALAPGKAFPVRWPLSPKPFGGRIDLLRIGCLLRHTCAVARCEVRHRIPHFRAYVGANHQNHTRTVATSHEGVRRPRRRMEEVPGSQESLLAFDEQPALTGQDEERLL